jgi:hypothetical protein
MLSTFFGSGLYENLSPPFGNGPINPLAGVEGLEARPVPLEDVVVSSFISESCQSLLAKHKQSLVHSLGKRRGDSWKFKALSVGLYNSEL